MALWKEPGAKDPFKEALPKEAERGNGKTEEESPRPFTPQREAPGNKESLIAAHLTIEGKIEGAGDVRIAGCFKGDVQVDGNVTIEPGARLDGEVRAQTVIISGELQGNIQAASRVELLGSGSLVGDVKAGSLTVAQGARMRGRAEFGWDGIGKDHPGTARRDGSAL